jgi:hypothetical protein
MKTKLAALLASGAVAGFLAMNGISLASAQDSSTTTTPSRTDGAPADDAADPDCPHRGDDGDDGAGTTSSSTDTEDAPSPEAVSGT